MVFLFRGPIVATSVAAVGRAIGYNVRYDALRVANGHVVVDHPDVSSLGGEPVFTAQTLDLTYDMRTIGRGPHFFGISSVSIERPKLTIIHHRDGSYNVHPFAARPGAKATPFVFPQIAIVIRNGSIGLLDDTRIFRHSRRFALQNVQFDAEVDPHALSRFTFGTTLVEDGGAFPIVGRGRFDPARGYELVRFSARTIALAPLLDYALNSTALHIANGVLRDVDARVYGLADHAGTIERHIAMTANLDHFQPYLNSLAKPLRDGRGTIRVYDTGLALPKIDGSIAGVPVRIAGAVYDLAHPTLRLGIAGHGELARLLTLENGANRLPLRGPVAFRLLVEGDATAPQTLASFSSPRIVYDRVPLEQPSGLVALNGPETAIVRSSLRYDGVEVGARGRVLSVGKHTNVELVANLAGSSAQLPYAGTIAPDVPLSGLALVTGTDTRLAIAGTLDGATATQHLAGTFAIDGRGVGTVGPLRLDGPGDRGLVAYAAFERPGFRNGAALLFAHGLRFSTHGAHPSLPAASGALDANLAAAFDGARFAVGGDVRLVGAEVLGYPIDDFQARARLSDGTRVAVDGRYRGSLAALAALAGPAGRGIAVAGRVDVPFSAQATSATDALVAIDGARFAHATIGGIALDGLDATIGVRGRTLDVYAARATLAGHDVVAHGSFGNGGTLAVSARDVDLATLRGLGLPVRAGTVTAIADVGGTQAAPTLRGGVAMTGVPVPGLGGRGLGVDANAGLAYADGTLDVRDGLVRAEDTVASVDGRIANIRNPRFSRYDVATHVRQADIATLARAARVRLPYPEGSLDADVRLTGTGRAPRIAGRIAVPEGSLNGLRFHDASIALAGTPAAIAATGGHVTVGSSVVNFVAALARGSQALALHAPRVDLADFNDYFDRGDTLGGRGSIAISARNDPNDIELDGRIALAHARYRRFDLGNARAGWSTRGRTVSFDGALGGAAGTISSNGTLALARTAPLHDALHRTDVAFAAHARGVDLGVWLPAAGVQAPVFGKLDADVRARGAFPDVAFDGTASLVHGLVGRVPVRMATLAAHGTHGHATISDAVLAIDGLEVAASGALGVHPGDPLDLRVRAQTPDVGKLATTLSGKPYDASGRASATVHVTGTFAEPMGDAVIDASALRYATTTFPRAHAEANLGRSRATLTRADIDFHAGRLLASGFVPLDRHHGVRVAGARAPISFDLAADRIDLGQFASLFPKGTTAAGTFDGSLHVGGSIASPALDGMLALANGTFVGPQFRSRLRDAHAQLTFAGSSATLHDAHATLGGGTLDATGSATLPTLASPARDVAYRLDLRAANASVDVPRYLRGRIDGTIALTRSAASAPLLAGTVALSSARVPLAAILGGSSPASATAPTPFDLALDLGVDVGRDVRVQGGPADIGAQGSLRVGGTLAAPTASGELDSTGGTIGFYRTFRLQDPSFVTFAPSDGVIPNVDATATTTVDNPPTDVTLHVTGLATQLDVALRSDPNYSRSQILGLLVGAQTFGAVSGVQTVANGGSQINPFQAAAEGQLGTLLTQNILEPLSSQLGGALGLSNLAINYSVGGSFDIGAQKKIFKNVTAVFAQSFNYPPRQSIGLRASPNDATAIQLTFFSQPSSNQFDPFSGNLALLSTNQSVTSTQPANGASGFSISIQRRFR